MCEKYHHHLVYHAYCFIYTSYTVFLYYFNKLLEVRFLTLIFFYCDYSSKTKYLHFD